MKADSQVIEAEQDTKKVETPSKSTTRDVLVGNSHPLGATVGAGGVNFSVFSKDASAIDLLLFDDVDDGSPSRVIALDKTHRTYHYWHVFVRHLRPGQVYAFRAHGPFEPSEGYRFDAHRVLLDPYGRAVVVPSRHSLDDPATAMKSAVVDSSSYDWEGDQPLHHPSTQTIIYEMHVRGFTQHPSSELPDAIRGTYAGVVSKIPYLRTLGITAVELLPIFQFDLLDAPRGRRNYWGYAPVSMFAPHVAYSSRRDPLGPLVEFRDMVKALHRAGIEVILDVVFNHTAEGDHNGPTFCFRGLANREYYILERDRSRYANFTGTGNTFNANHPIVRRLIVESLRYWVQDMHVDGFRFDLAAILSRDADGRPMSNPPVLWDIESDPALAGTKLIAEAWDAAGLYQVGSFIGDAWKEWNGHFRDDIRAFLRGDAGTVERIADRLIGSPAIYQHKGREPEATVNFVTCHDGFTLNDLVSYNQKHNDANGEGNRDGTDDNRSWNCGVEGATDDVDVEKLRNRQIKNCLTLTAVSIGVPLILMGDEVRRTQCGNNNAYCQDNETSWFDWTLLEQHADIHRFVQLLLARRVRRDATREPERLSLASVVRDAMIAWHGVTLGQPDWQRDSHSLVLGASAPVAGLRIHLIMNAYWESLTFDVPPVQGSHVWHRWIDTSLDSPDDIHPWDASPSYSERTYHVGPRSVVGLLSALR